MKRENPYRVGSEYWKIFECLRKARIVTRSYLAEKGFNRTDITIVLSPRKEGFSSLIDAKTGKPVDCRGNYSSQGHIYYSELLKPRWDGEPQRYRLRWRNPPLQKRVRLVRV